MTDRVRRTIRVLFSISLFIPTLAHAQSELPGRIEVSVGAVWSGPARLGARDANEVTGSGGSFRLFTSSSELAAATGVEARVSMRVLKSVDAEASGSYGRPDMRTRIDTDVETSNAPIVIAAPVQIFTVGGGVLWSPDFLRFGAAHGFAGGGARYLRRIEGDGVLLENGAEVDAGAGVKLMLKSRGARFWKGVGVRVDARALARSKALSLDDRVHVSPAIGASLFFRF